MNDNTRITDIPNPADAEQMLAQFILHVNERLEKSLNTRADGNHIIEDVMRAHNERTVEDLSYDEHRMKMAYEIALGMTQTQLLSHLAAHSYNVACFAHPDIRFGTMEEVIGTAEYFNIFAPRNADALKQKLDVYGYLYEAHAKRLIALLGEDESTFLETVTATMMYSANASGVVLPTTDMEFKSLINVFKISRKDSPAIRKEKLLGKRLAIVAYSHVKKYGIGPDIDEAKLLSSARVQEFPLEAAPQSVLWSA